MNLLNIYVFRINKFFINVIVSVELYSSPINNTDKIKLKVKLKIIYNPLLVNGRCLLFIKIQNPLNDFSLLVSVPINGTSTSGILIRPSFC